LDARERRAAECDRDADERDLLADQRDRQVVSTVMKGTQMARVFVTGSAQGLGRSAGLSLLDDGHQVVVHARDARRAAALTDLADQGATVVVGDLASVDQTRRLAEQVNELGRMDAVIHNAGVYADSQRNPGPEGHPRTLAVNTLAPYLLTVLIERPNRLIYLTSDMHMNGDDSLRDLDWTARRWNGIQAYCDSKLFVTALAFAVARRWPAVISNAVDPGWVPTRMGGPGAPDDLELGHLTQIWLAVGGDADATGSGQVWHHKRRARAAAAVHSIDFQDRLLDQLAELTGFELPDASAGTP
jgi:NAD(P)-dependent dehydrogenase (short-subunit alcohol dehydrogenase family)